MLSSTEWNYEEQLRSRAALAEAMRLLAEQRYQTALERYRLWRGRLFPKIGEESRHLLA